MEAISHAGTAIGILGTDGVVLAAEKKISSKLLEPAKSSEKMYMIAAPPTPTAEAMPSQLSPPSSRSPPSPAFPPSSAPPRASASILTLATLATLLSASPAATTLGLARYMIDDHVACAVAGITADANILINQARLHAQRYMFSYQEPQPVEQLVQRLCDEKQLYTQVHTHAPLVA